MPRSTFTRRQFVRSAAVAAAGTTRPRSFTGQRARAAGSKAKLKIWMHWDLEGTSGLFHREQAWYKQKDVQPEVAEEGIRRLIADVNSAAEAAWNVGATELLICDTHGGGGSFREKDMYADPASPICTAARPNGWTSNLPWAKRDAMAVTTVKKKGP